MVGQAAVSSDNNPVPNLFRNAVPLSELRKHTRFISLPPLHALSVCGPASWRYVRQEEELWDLLHAGVLTSSTLVGATALCERAAAQRIPGWPQYMRNHGSALFAASRLAQPLHSSFHENSAAAVQEARIINDRAMLSLNSVKLEQREASLSAQNSGEHLSSKSCAYPHTSGSRPCSDTVNSIQKSTGGNASAAQPGDATLARASIAGAGLPALCSSGVDTSWLGDSVRVQMLGSVGPTNRRTRVWAMQAAAPISGGSEASCSRTKAPELVDVQESQKSEWLQGSSVVVPISQGPKRKKKRKKGGRCGGSRSEHTSQPASSTNETKSVQLQAETLPSTCTGQQHTDCSSDNHTATPHALEAIQHDEFVKQVHVNAQLAMQQHSAAAQRVARQGEGRLRTTWGSVQEAAALLEVLQMFTFSTVHEAGLCMLDQESVPTEWGIDLQQLQVGASPDALIFHPSRGSNGGNGVQPQPEWVNAGKHWHKEAAGIIDLPGQWEVIEVKNHCPFAQEIGKKGRKRWKWRDSGPREVVPAQYVGQLQLEMMCTGLQSALLVSRSSSKGTNVFRIYRNDSFCKCLLLHASRFKSQYTSGYSPPPNFFSSWATHHELIRLITVVQRSAQLLCHLPSHHCLGQSQPKFCNSS